MKLPNRKRIKIPLGILCIILGIAGLFLPILQGIALIILGLVLLGFPVNKHLKKQWEKIRKKN
ncbi:MAG: hypothetical protein KJ858_00335 [Nanoarchaeota archaeon]|nr:hypothetical protein [Nanoarchaeota archaeon]